MGVKSSKGPATSQAERDTCLLCRGGVHRLKQASEERMQELQLLSGPPPYMRAEPVLFPSLTPDTHCQIWDWHGLGTGTSCMHSVCLT